MILTNEQKEQIKKSWGDWESVHSLYDDFLKKRLNELDPEFMQSLNVETKGARFWYA